jgi:hypothetical protein
MCVIGYIDRRGLINRDQSRLFIGAAGRCGYHGVAFREPPTRCEAEKEQADADASACTSFDKIT